MARVKEHPCFTDALAQDLGIVGAEQTFGPSSMKPVLKLSLQADHPNVGWKRLGMDSIEIWVDRGDGKGFVLLTFDTTPNYTDTTPFPSTPTKWTDRAIYRVGDSRVGQWSKPVSVTVGG